MTELNWLDAIFGTMCVSFWGKRGTSQFSHSVAQYDKAVCCHPASLT